MYEICCNLEPIYKEYIVLLSLPAQLKLPFEKTNVHKSKVMY